MDPLVFSVNGLKRSGAEWTLNSSAPGTGVHWIVNWLLGASERLVTVGGAGRGSTANAGTARPGHIETARTQEDTRMGFITTAVTVPTQREDGKHADRWGRVRMSTDESPRSDGRGGISWRRQRQRTLAPGRSRIAPGTVLRKFSVCHRTPAVVLLHPCAPPGILR